MITLDLQEVKGHTAQLQKIGVHINQIAKCVMKRFVKCFFELLTQALIRAVGIFASFAKKYYLSLDSLNSQNGLRAEIAFHN